MQLKPTKKIICPHCGKETTWQENTTRPFCSERCRLLDLGQWATEQYRISAADDADPDREEESDG